MPILFFDRITRQQLRDHPDWLFVFGDNLERQGRGGLARECRGEPNAIGIVTKPKPSMEAGAFLSNADLQDWKTTTKAEWATLRVAVREGRTIIFPKGGLGAGLAELPKRAPAIMRAIEGLMGQL